MTRPFDVEVPTQASAGQIIGCATTLWRVLAWDLGEKYDAYMRANGHGADWLENLRLHRVQGHQSDQLYLHPLKLHDVSFVLREPTHFSDRGRRASAGTRSSGSGSSTPGGWRRMRARFGRWRRCSGSADCR